VPKVPEWIRGVINLRGSVVPVVDLSVRFGLGEQPVTKTTCIVILEVAQDSERAVMGVIADAVNQVIDLTPDAAIRALEIGAVDIITKPKIGIRGFFEESAVLLEDTVRAASTARVNEFRALPELFSVRASPDNLTPAMAIPVGHRQKAKIVAIGASTGGTEALLHVLEQMPLDCPGIVAVQHMPLSRIPSAMLRNGLAPSVQH
jgi:chemotaxis response regulator CheB